MAEYLKDGEHELSVQERQYLFQCRMRDIDAHAHRTWKYKDIYCISCEDRSTIEDIIHILECKTLLNKNEHLTYLPTESDLYSSNIEEQIYASFIIRENMHIRESLRNQRLVAHVN